MNRLFLLILLCTFSVNLFAEREASTSSERELLDAVIKNDTISIYHLIDENVAVDITNFEEVSLLMLAAQKNNKDLVKLLVKKGADPNYLIRYYPSGIDGPSPLNGENVLNFAFKSNDPAMVELLIGLGAKLNIKDLEKPLSKASLDNNVDMVKYLLKKGGRVSNDVGQFLVVSHMKRKQDPIYKQMIIRKNEDFRIVKIWENYGIAINENTLIKAKLLDKKNIAKYITAYKEWKANGSPDPEPIKKQEIQTQPSQEYLDSIAKEAQIRTAQEEAQIASERVVTAERLQQEKETRDKELKTFVYSIGILFVLFALRKKLVIWIKQLYNKLKTPLSIFSKLRFNRQSQTQQSDPIEKAIINKSVYTTEKGWTVDDTLKLEVNYLTIEDIINPIRMTNEHERYVREMIWYVRKVEKTNEDKQQVNDMLISKWKQVNPKLVRSIYIRSLFIILENYSKQNSKVKQLARNVKFKQ